MKKKQRTHRGMGMTMSRPAVSLAIGSRIRLARLVLLLLATCTLAVAATVRPERWLNDVKYLASEELKGRGDGTPELDQAAAYIEEQFRETGLEPLSGGFFQSFTASTGAELGTNNQLVAFEPESKTYRLRRDFIPLSFSSSGETKGAVVFVGYGITAPEYNYDDYEGVDVRGKIVLMLRHEPQENDEASVFRGRQLTRHAEFVRKAINARNHGATAGVIVDDPVNHSHSADRLVPFGTSSGPNDAGIPIMQVRQDVVLSWMNQAGRSFVELQKAIDRDLTNHSFVLPAPFQLSLHTDVKQQSSQLKNVIGVLRGTDPKLRNEYIVIGAHYDHLGLGHQGGSLTPSQIGQIHHGADDNASGTAGMMELARYFASERENLRRSILFMAYAGEELGLLGSAHYVQEPLVPLNQTIAMLNLDMIGRVNNNKLYVGGVGTSPSFRKLVEEENQVTNFDLDFSELGYDASDHMSFGRNRVPVMFFFSGLHADYHKPSDTWDKVEPAETALVLELVARVARRIDQTDERPAYTPPPTRNQRNTARASDEQNGYGAYFGSVPDFGQTEKGVKFADVREDSPAAKAGLKPGDVLVKFDGMEILNLYDFTDALQRKSPGDEVPVVVLRNGQEVQASVTLGRRE
ncbi:MAG: M28 family peptidase [Acidobacteria bacterium]|nr:M28 family peptidase [Acidobacteriota bacterium]